MRIFGREPTVWLQVLSAILAFVVSFGFDWLTAEQAALSVALVSAVIGTFNAFMVRPLGPAVFDMLVKTGAALLAGYGLNLNQEKVGLFQMALIAIMTLILRGSVTPVNSPAAGGGVSTVDVPEAIISE